MFSIVTQGCKKEEKQTLLFSGVELSGTVTTQSGSSASLKDWVFVLMNIQTGESRVSAIGAKGDFALSGVDLSKEYNIALLNAEYKLSAVLAMPSDDDSSKVYTSFMFKGSEFPLVTLKGGAVDFSIRDDIEILNYIANDSDEDGIPDGLDDDNDAELLLKSTVLRTQGFSLVRNDTDGDKIADSADPDMDGDGILNYLDADANGEDTLDVFESDINGDGMKDSLQSVGKNYFDDFVKYSFVQQFIDSDGDIKFRAGVKMHPGQTAESVQVLGPDSAFLDSEIVYRSEDGYEETGGDWDYSLADDGESFDDAAKDSFFSSKAKLANGSVFRERQIVFVVVDRGTYKSIYPSALAAVDSGELEITYDANTRKITKSGSPFGEGVDAYLWSVAIYDEDDRLVVASSPMDGDKTTYTVGSGDLDDDVSYYAIASAQSVEKITGYPEYVIESDSLDLD